MKQYHATQQIVMVETGEILAMPGPVTTEEANRVLDYLGRCDMETFYDYRGALVAEGEYELLPDLMAYGLHNA